MSFKLFFLIKISEQPGTNKKNQYAIYFFISLHPISTSSLISNEKPQHKTVLPASITFELKYFFASNFKLKISSTLNWSNALLIPKSLSYKKNKTEKLRKRYIETLVYIFHQYFPL